MGFLTGRVTFLRYRVDGSVPGLFGPDHLEKLAQHVIGKQRTESKDGTEVGWIAGEDILDTNFELEKNVVADALSFSLRVDTQKLPGDLLRAYAREELESLAASNPSGRPNAKQKKEAREAARERLELEGQDGRFTRRKASPLLWDGQANQLLVGATSPSVLDHVQRLFQETFGCSLTFLDAGQRALDQVKGEVELRPSLFLPGAGQAEVTWADDTASPVFLGNEFLLWLWFTLEEHGDTLALADGSQLAVMLAKTLSLECPRGLSGSETIRSDGPTRLPEARRAIQAGKLPRQAGLILVRHDQQYELTLQAEILAVNGAKLPKGEEIEERARMEERVGQLRQLLESLDRLYDAFLHKRLGSDWAVELAQIQKWLQREKKSRLAEAA